MSENFTGNQIDHPNAQLFNHAPFGRMVRGMTREGSVHAAVVIAVHTGNGNWTARREIEPGIVSRTVKHSDLRWRDFAMETVEDITGTHIVEQD